MKKSDISPLEQAFDAGFFAEVSRDAKEENCAKKTKNARVGLEIQTHLCQDSGLPELQKSPVSVLSPNSAHAAVQSSKIRSEHVHKMSRKLRKKFGPRKRRFEAVEKSPTRKVQKTVSFCRPTVWGHYLSQFLSKSSFFTSRRSNRG